MNPRTTTIDPPLSTTHISKPPWTLYSISTYQWVTLSSIPLFIGSYIGYRMEVSRTAVSEAAATATATAAVIAKSNNSSTLQPTLSKNAIRPINGPLLAFKALGIGTMLSIAGVGLITSVVFRAHGCSTLEELIMIWKEWAPRKRKELLEDTWGIIPKSMQHEDVVATRGFSEDEEWEYIKRKYIPELVVSSSSDNNEDEK